MSQSEGPRQAYFGYVVGNSPWAVRIQNPGPYSGRQATIAKDTIPQGVFPGMDVRFDLTTAGRNTALVAYNLEAYVKETVNS